jgi:Phospholipase_D-nuclease N-terminal
VLAVLATDYPFLDIFWTMMIFFFWVIWIWLLILVLSDNFRRRDHSGWAKAGWTLFVIFLPLLGVLVYMIARPPVDESVMPRAAT